MINRSLKNPKTVVFFYSGDTVFKKSEKNQQLKDTHQKKLDKTNAWLSKNRQKKFDYRKKNSFR